MAWHGIAMIYMGATNPIGKYFIMNVMWIQQILWVQISWTCSHAKKNVWS